MELYKYLRAALVLLIPHAVCQLWMPGQSPPNYADGSFIVPTKSTTAFTVGQVVYIKWNSSYTYVNIFLITDGNFSNSQILAQDIPQPSSGFEWTVNLDMSLTPNNDSQIYVFRAADTNGNEEAQDDGGFASSSFYIHTNLAGLLSSTSSSALASSSTSLTSTSTADSSTASISASAPSVAGSGLNPGAKAGIGVGVSLGSLAVISIIAALFYASRRRSNEALQPQQQAAETPGKNLSYVSQGYQGQQHFVGPLEMPAVEPVYEMPLMEES